MGTTYWNPVTKKNVDVTDSTPLPVGGGVLGQEWDADAGQIYSLSGTVNGRLGTLCYYLYPIYGASMADSNGFNAMNVVSMGFEMEVYRGADGAHTQTGYFDFRVAARWGMQVFGENGVAPTAWDVRLEMSLMRGSGNHGWYEVLDHKTADGDKTIKWITDRPASAVRVRVASLTRGAASAVRIYVVGTP